MKTLEIQREGRVRLVTQPVELDFAGSLAEAP